MIPLEQVKALPARWREVLAKHGVADARAFAALEAEEVESWFADDAQPLSAGSSALERWPKAYQVRWWQAEARTLSEAEQPSEPKWFLAIHDLSDEGVLPYKDIPSGGRVNLFYRTDAEIERLIELGIIARIGADVRLLVNEAWLPFAARKQLNLGGIYSLEALAAGQADFGGKQVDVVNWLGEAGLGGQAAGWLAHAQELLKVAPKP